MSRRSVIYLALTLVLLAYLVMAVTLSRAEDRSTPYTDLQIVIEDTARTDFVTASDIDSQLDGLSKRIRKTPRSAINTLRIEQRLNTLPKVERARCVALNNGALRISVVPMRPVARVFDNALSYYINAEGKRMPAAGGRYVDVPVITGHFADPRRLLDLLPMFNVIRHNPDYDALVTSVALARNGDIIVTPAVLGHVVNLGDTSMVADKFTRLHRIYADVMPVKGWEFYDTDSDKWRGRVVATRRTKKLPDNRPLTELDGIVDEVPDFGTVSTEGAAADSVALHPFLKNHN